MARPKKWRSIENLPAAPFFIPSEQGLEDEAENILNLEELEAIRLKDLEGLEQREGAEKMGISRPTFQRILLSAREKIADSLVNGKTLRIEGGNFRLKHCPAKCLDCQDEWIVTGEQIEEIKSGGLTCPHCGSHKIDCQHRHRGKFCKKHCRRQGWQEE